jgi:predicted acyl esterase
VVILHGLGGDRSSSLALSDSMGLDRRFAVLAFDARGHGQSGGLIGIDGPREIADTQAVFSWLRDRPDVSDTRIGGFGTSYGGGALWNSLAAGTPWATLAVNITWTDLRSALMPQNLVKSGVVAGLLGSLPPERIDPEVLAIRDAAFISGDIAPIIPWGARRSSLPSLKGVKTPVLMMQGRRDFLFGLDQAYSAWSALAGPKRLWLGLHGHAPSGFPAPDTTSMLAEASSWLDLTLGVPGAKALDPRPIAISPESWSGAPVRLASLPAVRRTSFALAGASSIVASGKVQRSTPRLKAPLEVFGAPTVTVRANAVDGWSRLVAILSARTPAGAEIVVAGGGVPTRPGSRSYRIVLGNQATFVPRGSRLTLTLASSSLAQNPGNLLYLDLPMAAGARVTVGPARLVVPALTKPVSR